MTTVTASASWACAAARTEADAGMGVPSASTAGELGRILGDGTLLCTSLRDNGREMVARGLGEQPTRSGRADPASRCCSGRRASLLTRNATEATEYRVL
eukprot:2544147-Rhodomonas_salina.1